MKRSFGIKMALILSVFVCMIIAASLVASHFFLGDYYLYGKQLALEETYKKINSSYVEETRRIALEKGFDIEDFFDGTAIEDNTTITKYEDAFEQLSENKAVSILIFRDSNSVVYDFKSNQTYKYQPIIYSSIGMETKDSIENSNMYNDFVDSNGRKKVIKKTDKYIICQTYVSRLSSNYLYLSATLDNGESLLLRASYDSMEESVKISTRFILYISVLMLILGVIVIFLITRRMVKPLTKLSTIAKEMAQMNFDTRYEVKTGDEIGELGGAINYMSDNLERTLGELKSANQQLRQDLEIRNKNDEMRRDFLSNVSHELKTPIALIQGYAEGLVENINDDEESRAFYCDVIMDEATKMNNLVKKLLDLNQLEFGTNTVKMEHFNLSEVINNLLFNADILFKQKEVVLEKEIPDHIYAWADIYMVEEIFNNYLTNAFNHVTEKGTIKVTVDSHEDIVRVTVFNTGLPIPEEDINQIWDKFYKVDKARTREYGGSGVGLSIVKASMELLGQKYGVENKENGVLFYFELDGKNN